MEGRGREAEKFCGQVTDVMHTLANEPSLGIYYVIEHIQRAVPALVEDKVQLAAAAEACKGAGLDAGFALEDMTAATSGSTLSALQNVARLADQSSQRLRT